MFCASSNALAVLLLFSRIHIKPFLFHRSNLCSTATESFHFFASYWNVCWRAGENFVSLGKILKIKRKKTLTVVEDCPWNPLSVVIIHKTAK